MLEDRVRRMIGRGVTSIVDTSKKMTELQVETARNGIIDNVEYFEPFGLTSSPPLESECTILNIGGDQSLPIALNAALRDLRPKGATPGQTILYDAAGSKITLDNDDNIIMSYDAFLKLDALAANHLVQREKLVVDITNVANATVPSPDGGKAALLALASQLDLGTSDQGKILVP